MIEVKASIQYGERLKSYNAWNKEMPIAVKGVGTVRDAFQLPPMVRVIIPTDTSVELKDDQTVSKVYSNKEVALKKGLVLVGGVQLVTESGKVELVVQNISDSLVIISNGDLLGNIVTA